MRVHNSGYVTKFFDIGSLSYVDPLRTGIRKSEFNTTSLDAHTKNCLRMSQRPDTYLPVLKNVIPLPARTTWEIGTGVPRQLNKLRFSTKSPKTLIHVQRIANQLISLIKGDVAVELSGGLDTSVVIGVLQSIGVDPILIGAVSDRYEFRTERFIQEKIAATSNKVYFVEEKRSLPFAQLKEAPVHAIPNKASLFYYLNAVTAKWASLNAVKFVVNGIGFDSILIDGVGEPCGDYLFDPVNLDDGWANDFVYKDYGVQYVNVASIHCVLKALITMRVGQPDDPRKLWARGAFRGYIPEELSKYTYKASFGAVYNEGLIQAKSAILEICDDVYRLTGLSGLKPSTMSVLLNGVNAYDHQAEFEFLARLSYANWIYQLQRANLIIEG